MGHTETMKNVIIVIGAGQIGQAIARRLGVGKHVLLADMRPENAEGAAKIFTNAGYEVSVATVDVSSRATVQHIRWTSCDRRDARRKRNFFCVCC